METPLCPICNSKEHLENYYTGIKSWEFPGQFSYVKCQTCGLIFQSPREPISKIAKYYKPATYWGQDVAQTFTFERTSKERQKHYGPVYKEIFNRKPGGKILDVGSGLGLFLSLFKESGWQVLGTETSKAVARFSLKTFNVPVKIGLIEKLNLPKKSFDVISFIGVFEHIYSPNPTLRKISTLLKPDGLLVIVPPNIDSLGHKIFTRRWYSLDPGRHLYHYSPDTIKKILAKNGFTVVTILHNHWEYNYYSIFSNLRFLLSPKFQNLVTTTTAAFSPNSPTSSSSLVVEAGKVAARVVAVVVSVLEPILGMGESMIVIAKKS